MFQVGVSERVSSERRLERVRASALRVFEKAKQWSESRKAKLFESSRLNRQTTQLKSSVGESRVKRVRASASSVFLKAKKWFEERREEKKNAEIVFARRLLSKLVEFKTMEGEEIELRKCANFLVREARKLGLPARIVEGSTGPNVVADLNVGAEQTLLLVAHYDVVPAGNGWSVPPFKLSSGIVEGKRVWFARGACDDKGDIVAAFLALKKLREAGDSKVNVCLLVTCDEETRGKGLACLFDEGVRGDAALIVDACPKVVNGCSASVQGKIELSGGLKGITRALERLVEFDKVLSEKRSQLRAPQGCPHENIWGRFSLTMLELEAASSDLVLVVRSGEKENIIPGECVIRMAAPNSRGDKKILELAEKIEGSECRCGGANLAVNVKGVQGHAGYPHTTENAIVKALPALKLIAGNGLSGKCKAVFDMRLPPEESREQAKKILCAHLEKIESECGVKIKFETTGENNGYFIPASHPFVQAVREALGTSEVIGELGTGDVDVFAERSEPVVGTGVSRDGTNFHGANEFVFVEDILLISDAVYKLCAEWKKI